MGPALDVSGAASRVFLFTLEITNIVEQEALDVSIHGSADGTAWGPKPLAIVSSEILPRTASSAA